MWTQASKSARRLLTCAWLLSACSSDALDPDPEPPPVGQGDASVIGSLDAGQTHGDAAPAPVGMADASQVPDSARPLDAGQDAHATPGGSDASTPASDAQVVAPLPDSALAADGGNPTQPSTATRTLVPHASWTCAMPAGIPPPELGTLAFTAEFTVSKTHDMGPTQYGQRKLLEFSAGSFKGDKLTASLMKGGFELGLTLANGAVELEQVLMLEAQAGAPIYLRVCGLAANSADPVRVVMDFEAPNASHGALNTAKLVGVRELSADGKQLTMRVYDVGKVSAGAPMVSIEEPAGVPEQTWECKTGTGTKGAEMYRETVGIGASVSVGASKRGNRNVIPITGGTTSGRLKGKILALGADFQLLGSPFVIDARYVVLTDDNELVIVRNCGALGALIPVFEARTQGPYAWINEDRWLSSNPSIGLGSVSLTIYEKR